MRTAEHILMDRIFDYAFTLNNQIGMSSDHSDVRLNCKKFRDT